MFSFGATMMNSGGFVGALVVTTSLLSSLATIYIREPTLVVLTADSEGAAEQYFARSLKAIDPDKAEKHFRRARKVINNWQSGNLAMGNELYKVRMVPGPRGRTGPAGLTEDKFINTSPGTAKASKALVVDSNKEALGSRWR